jgi:hypothetical protein
VDWVRDLVPENGRIAAHEVANVLGISFGPVYSNLKNGLNMCELLKICPLPAE